MVATQTLSAKVADVMREFQERQVPENPTSLTPQVQHEGQAHADYWREAYCAVQSKQTGEVTLVTLTRAPYLDGHRVLCTFKPADVPASQWPHSPVCVRNHTPGALTTPGYRPKTTSKTLREIALSESVPSTSHSISAPNTAPRKRTKALA